MADTSELAGEVRKLVNILALGLITDKAKGESAAILSAVGLSTKEIAGLLGTSENSIRALLSQSKKKGSRAESE